MLSFLIWHFYLRKSDFELLLRSLSQSRRSGLFLLTSSHTRRQQIDGLLPRFVSFLVVLLLFRRRRSFLIGGHFLFVALLDLIVVNLVHLIRIDVVVVAFTDIVVNRLLQFDRLYNTRVNESIVRDV